MNSEVDLLGSHFSKEFNIAMILSARFDFFDISVNFKHCYLSNCKISKRRKLGSLSIFCALASPLLSLEVGDSEHSAVW